MSFANLEHIALASPAEIYAVQNQLFHKHLRYCAQSSPFYRHLLNSRGIDIEQMDLCHIGQLPLTSKEDLENYNDQFLAVPAERIVDIVQSSGTTGRPTRIMYTERDLQRLAYNEKQSFSATGLAQGDVVLLTCTMDRCFIAGLAYFLGLRELGAATIRNGHGTLEGHRDVIARMKPTAIVGVPSFIRKLGLYLKENGDDPRATLVRRIICIGEPLRDRGLAPLPVARDLMDLWNAQVFSTYASSETISTCCECEAGNGGHILPKLAVTEILDDAGNVVSDGEIGEVVVTPLQIEGMPLLRFRTGDISFLRQGKCSCGRLSPRLGPILGRRKQMLKLKGTTIYPEAIALALEEFGKVQEFFVEVKCADVLSDQVTVYVCAKDQKLTAVQVGDFLSARLRARPEVVIASEAMIRERVFSPQYRKPMRFFDRRKA